MERKIKLAVNDIQKINLADYEDDEYLVAKMSFISNIENSHGYIFSEEVIRKYAPTVLNKWLIADMTGIVDCGTHTDNQNIVGQVPKEQSVDFYYDDEGYLRAAVDVVISKIYAKDFCNIFENDNKRSVSMEAIIYSSDEDESIVESFKVLAVTVLGKMYNPSVTGSNIVVTRFSEENANAFFNKVHNKSLTNLEKFTESRKKLMAESKTYKIDKSKEAISNADWSDVDKTKLRNKIIEAKNASTLVKAVYLKVDEDWSEAPSQRLHYPVMQFDGDTLVYNRNALSNALARATQKNETAVISKIKKIYKNLDLEQDGKETDTKMAEIKFAAVDIGALWSNLWDALNSKYPDGEWGSVYRIDGIYEEDNKKFVIIHYKDETTKYRLDFSLTEEGLFLADEIVKVELEIVETDEVKKFAEPENADKYKIFAKDNSENKNNDNENNKNKNDKEAEMSVDEMKKEMARLQSESENKDNIIMECKTKMSDMETELSQLREYKAACEQKELATSVEKTMEEVKDCMSDDKYKEFRDEGLSCKLSEFNAWSNKVKAFCFENGKLSKNIKKNDNGVFSFSAPIENKPKTNSLWD